jgi:tRNA (cytidine/uridine-2'-O-)-methyltransferase
MIACALFEPDIPQNTGAILRLGACFGVPIHIIHPAGFTLSDQNLKRAGMDYLSRADLIEHANWEAFQDWRQKDGRRLVALSTKGSIRLDEYRFEAGDVLLLGRESAGLPDHISQGADAVVRIPIRAKNRSLNVANAASIAVFEALRQTSQLPVGQAEAVLRNVRPAPSHDAPAITRSTPRKIPSA